MAAEISVVDASVIAAIAFVEPNCERAAEMLTGKTLIAPALLDIEFANICLVKQRRFKMSAGAIRTAWELRDDFSIELFGVDIQDVFSLASSTGLTAYDACYLWLAKVRAAGLTTLDKPLDTAFRMLGSGNANTR
jgi:predicted nucleic acid-binding protein